MRRARAAVGLALVASLSCLSGCICCKSGGAMGKDRVAKMVPAEQDGWELVFSDDFNRNDLGKDWTVVDGTWTVADGALRGSGTLISSVGFPGDDSLGFQRFEFDAVTDVQPIIFFKNKPKPKVSVGDMSSFIQAAPPEEGNPLRTGYFFQFGGMNNTLNQVRRAGASVDCEANLNKVIVPDQVHHVVVENDKGDLKFFVDGEKILEHKEKQSIMGKGHDRVGFYFYTAAKVNNVKVYVKRLPNDLDLD